MRVVLRGAGRKGDRAISARGENEREPLAGNAQPVDLERATAPLGLRNHQVGAEVAHHPARQPGPRQPEGEARAEGLQHRPQIRQTADRFPARRRRDTGGATQAPILGGYDRLASAPALGQPDQRSDGPDLPGGELDRGIGVV